MNWKVLLLYYIVASGIWSLLLKISSVRLGWKPTLIYCWIGYSLVYVIYPLRHVDFGWNKYYFTALIAGVIAAVGTIAFYKALVTGPISWIIPLSSLYILIAVILGILLLKSLYLSDLVWELFLR